MFLYQPIIERRSVVIEKIIFNFFEDSIEESLEKIITYFRLDEDEVKKYIGSFNESSDVTIQDFVVNFGIKLADFDNRSAGIMCRHMTTLTKEGLEDVKTKGLLDLVGVLTEDTVLNRFLKENQVEFDVQNKRLIVDGQVYIISTTDEQCLFCVEKKEIRCGRFEHCDIREKMDYFLCSYCIFWVVYTNCLSICLVCKIRNCFHQNEF